MIVSHSKHFTMRRLVATLLLAGSFIAAGAQQVIYDENAEIRSVGTFNSIELSGTVSLYLSQGKSTAVAVSAGEQKYNTKIKTEVKNKVLKISVDGGVWNGFSWSNRKLKAYVSVEDLNSLQVEGASNAIINDNLVANALTLSLSGASELKGTLQVKNLNINMRGASVMRISGSADNAVIEASGACKLNGFGLKVDIAKVEASGASHITITANKDFNANASGGSSIQYKGEAAAGTVNSGAGAVIKKSN